MPLNAAFTIILTPLLIVIFLIFKQSRNASLSIISTLAGIVKSLNPLQDEKDFFPIYVKFFGSFMLFNTEHSENAPSLIFDKFSGKTTLSSFKQLKKVPMSISYTFSGIFIDFSPQHSINAFLPITSKESGIFTLIKSVQASKVKG